jgi:hypothetical protein
MKLFSAIKLIFTLHCDESSRLVSAALDHKLSFSERTAVRLHRLGCWSCRRLARQLKFIRQAAQTAGKPEVFGSQQLSEATRLKILMAIREQGDA